MRRVNLRSAAPGVFSLVARIDAVLYTVSWHKPYKISTVLYPIARRNCGNCESHSPKS